MWQRRRIVVSNWEVADMMKDISSELEQWQASGGQLVARRQSSRHMGRDRMQVWLQGGKGISSQGLSAASCESLSKATWSIFLQIYMLFTSNIGRLGVRSRE